VSKQRVRSKFEFEKDDDDIIIKILYLFSKMSSNGKGRISYIMCRLNSMEHSHTTGGKLV
jgi:hypothetical protein